MGTGDHAQLPGFRPAGIMLPRQRLRPAPADGPGEAQFSEVAGEAAAAHWRAHEHHPPRRQSYPLLEHAAYHQAAEAMGHDVQPVRREGLEIEPQGTGVLLRTAAQAPVAELPGVETGAPNALAQ